MQSEGMRRHRVMRLIVTYSGPEEVLHEWVKPVVG
jgi:hypothetical protein